MSTAASHPVAVPRRRSRRRVRLWVMTALLLVVAAVWVYPFAWVVSASLKDQLEVFSAGLDLLPASPQWSNYSRAWVDADFAGYMLNTVLVTVFTVVVVVIRCAMAGYVLARYQFLGRKVVLGVLVATLFVPAGYTIIPVVELTQRLGLLNSLTGMVVALSGGGHVAAVLLYMGYFRGIPRELEEAAVIDRAGFFTVFTRIMLPLAGPVTATVVVLTFLATWNAFFLPLVFTFSRPELRTLSVGMQAFVGQNSVDWPGMAAAGTISLLPIVALFLVLQRYFFDGIAGAVKS
ncbi:carbohydrate ABC transporter permease [Auraticoccus monumenti]|uniref:Carbohydrate ABC transporter membrane protein 2, CUT1 family n=1 Tax=Auraticoccus monumenti TaxID=675864 RepID=A0A1G6TFP5_9ACTN|nr:carbohydrate ABC transporter permease [Auraticoccus monumenti]SDD27883.1 carbohydrate ABC transporter membrane protein 2, CUT1 family [Auraticoccus monumenti]